MSQQINNLIVAIVIILNGFPCLMAQWEPPAKITRKEIVQISDQMLATPDIPLDILEDIFRINTLRMEWDVGGKVFQPKDPSEIPNGADGKNQRADNQIPLKGDGLWQHLSSSLRACAWR